MAARARRGQRLPHPHFYQRWGAAIAVRDRVVREAAEIVQAANREVAGS